MLVMYIFIVRSAKVNDVLHSIFGIYLATISIREATSKASSTFFQSLMSATYHSRTGLIVSPVCIS
jgi:hypothetical protein